MKILERLKIELGNKSYFEDAAYIQFLTENGFTDIINTDYIKETMQKPLLFTVLDIFESVSNDIDIMRKVVTEFSTTSEASKYLQDRIQKIKDRISSIPDDPEENYSAFTLMYTRK